MGAGKLAPPVRPLDSCPSLLPGSEKGAEQEKGRRGKEVDFFLLVLGWEESEIASGRSFTGGASPSLARGKHLTYICLIALLPSRQTFCRALLNLQSGGNLSLVFCPLISKERHGNFASLLWGERH